VCQQKGLARRVPGQCWNEPGDKKYNPGPDEMNQDHGHVKGFQTKLSCRSKLLKP
tara:strand:+ start:122 stop:286 length:165 start_codon:yes stop_codon:yes gene_type:complete